MLLFFEGELKGEAKTQSALRFTLPPPKNVKRSLFPENLNSRLSHRKIEKKKRSVSTF